MPIIISFSEYNYISPEITFSLNGSSHTIRMGRWVQFLSLLAYRRLKNVQNGWVGLEDLANIAAFRKSSRSSIGKYISNSIGNYSQSVATFLQKTVTINTTGPYCLLLDSSQIQTDLDKLGKYIDYITIRKSGLNRDCYLLWNALYYNKMQYHYSSALKLIDEFLKVAETTRDLEPEAVPVVLLHLVEIECYSKLGLVDIPAIEGIIRKKIQSIRDIRTRNRLIVYYNLLQLSIAGSSPDKYNYSKKIVENTFDIIKFDAPWIPFRESIESGLSLKNFTLDFTVRKILNKQEYDKTLAIYKYNFPDRVDYLSMFGSIFKNDLRGNPINNEIISRYRSMFKPIGSGSGFMHYALGHRMVGVLIKQNQLDDAYELSNECLIQHPELYELASYRDLTAKYVWLKSQLGGIQC